MERKLIAAAVSSALALPMAAQAVEFSVSGQVNRAIISVDGGTNDGDLQHVDANSSSTRFRFTGSQELDNGLTAGVNLELGRPDDWRTRHAAVSLSSAGGTITLGQTSRAAVAAPYANLGGASWLGGVTNWCSYHSTIGGSQAVACVSNDPGRTPILKYDTPAIGPASISISTGDNDYLDAVLKIAGSMGDAGYDLRIGHVAEYDNDVAATQGAGRYLSGATLLDEYSDKAALLTGLEEGTRVWRITTEEDMLLTEDEGDLVEEGTYFIREPGTPARTEAVGDWTTISAAVSFGQGTSVAAAWGQEDTADESEYQYIALDHSYGAGSIGVYYKTGENGAGVDGSLWGVGIGHGLGSGVTAYAGYRQISQDSQEDVDLIVAGMRVSFN